MIFVNVVVIKDSVIDENYLFQGENDEEVVKVAEQKFVELCKSHVSNWDEYTADDIANSFDDGYVEFGNGSICVSWPDTDT